MRIGDVVLYRWAGTCNGKTKKHVGLAPDCEHCPISWDSFSYEGECEDFGCFFDHEFNVPMRKCMLPQWVKYLIKKIRKWED